MAILLTVVSLVLVATLLSLPVFFSYVLLVCTPSCRLTSRMHCLVAVLLASLLLERIACQASPPHWPTLRTDRWFVYSLTYIRTCGWAYFLNTLLIRPLHWPTSPVRCSFLLIFANIHYNLWQGLLLERVACLLSLLATSPTHCCPLSSSLAYLSYVLLVCPHLR